MEKKEEIWEVSERECVKIQGDMAPFADAHD